MNVLFLDYDGVVNTPMWDADGKVCRYDHPEDGRVNNFQCVQWVSEFCEKHGFDIVVTSTWRWFANYADCLRNGGLRDSVKILGRTENGGYKRGDDIRKYLDEHGDIDEFIILDDDADMGELADHLVRCQTNVGFNIDKFAEAEDLLRRLHSAHT